MKLSKTQKELIELMKNGWELGHSQGMRSRAWLQKDGVGCGGECKDMSISTFHVLRDKKLVEISLNRYPISKYKLTELGASL